MFKSFLRSVFVTGSVLLLASSEMHAAINQDSAGYYFQLGKEDQANRKYAPAWKNFELASKLDTKNPQIQLAIADVCLKMNRMAPAVKALENASSLAPSDYNTQWRLVRLYFDFGQFSKVTDMLPAIHTHVPEAKEWAFMMGKSYYSIQNYGKAIEFLKIALQNDLRNSEAAYLIGRMLVKMENYKAAVPYYEQALALDSLSEPSHTYELALVYATAEQFDASVSCFQKAISRGYQPQEDFYMNMAYTMADAHKTEEAIRMMQDLLSRRPQDMGLLGGLADVCYHSGQYKEAIKYWDEVLELDNKNARALYQIGLAYIRLGKDKDGQQLCDQAIHMDPSLAVLKHARQLPF